MGKVLAIDLGTKYIGLAISDEERKIAFPLKVIDLKETRSLIEKIKEEISAEKADIVLLGRPTGLAGGELPMTKRVEEFAKELMTIQKISVELVDERLSTKIATGSVKAGERKDAAAAAIFLQNYLDKSHQKN